MMQFNTRTTMIAAIGAAVLSTGAFAQDILVDYSPSTGGDGKTWFNECCDHYYAEDVTFTEDTEVNGLDIYTDFAPDNLGDYQITIWEDDGFGTPGNILMRWVQPGSGVTTEIHYSRNIYRHDLDFAPIIFQADKTYWIGATSVSGWHLGQQAVNFPPVDDGLMAWFQIDSFFAFTDVGDMSFRLRGKAGSGDCLTLAVSRLTAGGRATWDVSGATPANRVAVVYGFQPGTTAVNGIAGYCATFGIKGVNQGRIICQKSADAGGNISCAKTIPSGAQGLRVLSQAAQKNTCPDECISNLDDQIVQ